MNIHPLIAALGLAGKAADGAATPLEGAGVPFVLPGVEGGVPKGGVMAVDSALIAQFVAAMKKSPGQMDPALHARLSALAAASAGDAAPGGVTLLAQASDAGQHNAAGTAAIAPAIAAAVPMEEATSPAPGEPPPEAVASLAQFAGTPPEPVMAGPGAAEAVSTEATAVQQAVPAQPAIPAEAAVSAVPAVPAEAAVPAHAAIPAETAVRAERAIPAEAAASAEAAIPAQPAAGAKQAAPADSARHNEFATAGTRAATQFAAPATSETAAGLNDDAGSSAAAGKPTAEAVAAALPAPAVAERPAAVADAPARDGGAQPPPAGNGGAGADRGATGGESAEQKGGQQWRNPGSTASPSPAASQDRPAFAGAAAAPAEPGAPAATKLSDTSALPGPTGGESHAVRSADAVPTQPASHHPGRAADASALYAAAQGRNGTPVHPSHQVAIQISRAAEAGSERVTVHLRPASLGSITVELSVSADHKLVAAIAVDRQDTLDLLQRDARSLERALNDAGLKTDSGSLNFNLRGDGDQRDFRHALVPHHSDGPAGPEHSDLPESTVAPVRLVPAGGVDIQV